MMVSGTHYNKDCLCASCKIAGNRKYIGGGTYNINEKYMDREKKLKNKYGITREKSELARLHYERIDGLYKKIRILHTILGFIAVSWGISILWLLEKCQNN